MHRLACLIAFCACQPTAPVGATIAGLPLQQLTSQWQTIQTCLILQDGVENNPRALALERAVLAAR